MSLRKIKLIAASSLVALSIAQVFMLPASSQETGAKGLFYEQLDKPSSQLNTGVQYWIELHRGDKVMHVTNKTPFLSGDKIRFHVKSNVDAYAYILLKEGSGGEQSVLFPDPAHNDDVKLVHGRDYSLPSDGFLTFDQNPGMERLMLLLSRTSVDAQAYLENNKNDRAQIASLPDGSKDLIPAKIVLAYDPPKDAFKPNKQQALAQRKPQWQSRSQQEAAAPTHLAVANAPASHKKPHASSHSHKLASASGRHGSGGTHEPKLQLASTAGTTAASSKVEATATTANADSTPQTHTLSAGVVTVVHRDPNAVLALDLTLNHQ